MTYQLDTTGLYVRGVSVSAASRLKLKTTDMKSVVWVKLEGPTRSKLKNHGHETPWYLLFDTVIHESQFATANENNRATGSEQERSD